MDNANHTGAESLNVEQTAQRIVGLFDSPEAQERQEKPKAEPAKAEAQETPEQETSSNVETETAQEAQPEKQELSFENLTQLAEALEVPFDDFMGKIKARVKVSGEEREVSLKDLRDGYQMESDYRKKTSDLSEARKLFESDREKITTELQARYQEAQQISGFLENQLMGEYNSVNWKELRASNPAEFAAMQAEYNARYQQIQQVKQAVTNQLQAQKAELDGKQEEKLRLKLAEENERLQAAIPEFRDEAKANELRNQMRDYLKGFGYSESDIAQVYDHRLVMIFRDAMAYKALQSKKPELEKKVINLPKIQKPGAAKSKAEINSERVKQKLSQVRKTGSTKDLASLLLEKIN